MPAWIHDRADHIRSKNPGMPKSKAFAIATQQSYAAGKAPKGYGTAEGRREAKQKYDSPKSEYKKTASISPAMFSSFSDELEKIANGIAGPATTHDIQRKRQPLPKPISVPQLPTPPSPQTDSLSSSRLTPPPPVTSG